MRYQLVDTPRMIATIPRFTHLTMRVISGAILLARDSQTLTSGGGIPLAVADGFLSIPWDAGPVWLQSASGTTAEIALVLP